MKKLFCFILSITLVTGLLSFHKINAAPSAHLVIGEIQTTGGTGYTTDEFVELYNPTEADINLAGWKLTKKTATGKEYVLVDDFGELSIKSHSFFLVAHPAGYSEEIKPDSYYSTTNSISDNNTIILYDNASQVIDKVGFGSTIDFEGESLADPAGKKSVERKAKMDSTEETMIEGGADYFLGNAEDTDNNKQDFILRDQSEPQNSASEQEYLTIEVPTPFEPAKEAPSSPSGINEQLPQDSTTEEKVIYSDKIIISEFLPNPVGSDDTEFIELKNIGDADIDLNGWKLGDDSSRIFTIKSDDFTSTTIKAGNFFVIYKEISKISLNNTNDSANLYQPDDNLLDKVEYTDCQENQSYNLIDGEWIWSDAITPGKENAFEIKNELPVAEMEFLESTKVGKEIVFDASGSSDPDDDKLEYFWDFGDGNSAEGEEVEYTYQKAGEYTVTLKVVDEKGGEDEIEGKIEVTDYDYSDKIVINELLPAPDGPDKDLEWIEIFNPETRDINLDGWQLTDLKTYYKFSEDEIIKADDCLSIKRKDSKISLNDSGDVIFLINPAKEILNGVEYKKAKVDLAFARHEGTIHWSWTETPTPGGENEFVLAEEDIQEETTESTEVTESTEKGTNDQEVNSTPIELKISDVSEDYLKKMITITGDVERTSGRNIYLIDELGNDLRVYIQEKTNIKKHEDLESGDKLKVTGILDKTSAGLRLLPRTEEDLEIQKIEKVLGVEIEKEITGIPEGNEGNQVRLYLFIAGGALVIILAGVGIKYYLGKKKAN